MVLSCMEAPKAQRPTPCLRQAGKTVRSTQHRPYTVYQRLFNYMDTKAFVSVFSKRTAQGFSGIFCVPFCQCCQLLAKLSGQLGRKARLLRKIKLKYVITEVVLHTQSQVDRFPIFYIYIQNTVSLPPPPLAVAKAGNHHGQVKDHLPPHWDRRAIK